ncbi:MAG: hypothetical protein JNK56_06850 [Myxococcales bacterium]|nr:hypothetical protein [Myxococcales bacterium]
MPTTLALLALLPPLAFSPPLPAAAPAPGEPIAAPPRALIVAGATTLSIGLTTLVLMTLELRLGAARLREHDDLIAAAIAMQRPLTGIEHTRLASLDQQGYVANAAALGFGVAGAVATLVGATLLGRGLALHRRARLSWSPTPRGVGLTLRF